MVFFPSFLSCGPNAASAIHAQDLEQIEQSQNTLQGGNNAATSTTKAAIEQARCDEEHRQSGTSKGEKEEEQENEELRSVVASAPSGSTSEVSRRRGSMQALVQTLVPSRPSSPRRTFEEEAEKGDDEKEEVRSVTSPRSERPSRRRGSVQALVQVLTPSRPTTPTEQPIREKQWPWFKVSSVPTESLLFSLL